MRENFTYGSVRGAAGNGSPYRDRPAAKKVEGIVRKPSVLTIFTAFLNG